MSRSRDGVFARNGAFYISFIGVDGSRVKRKTNAATVQQARNLRAAESARAEKQRTCGYIEPSEITFAELVQQFLAHQKVRLCPAGFERTRGIAEGHLAKFFTGEIRAIRRANVARYVTKRCAEARPGSVIRELNVLKRMLRLASEEWELIPTNPARGVKPPKAPAGRLRYLQPTEVKAVLEACPDFWLRPIIAVAVATGMRRGEILGLRWMDVDLDHNRVLLPQSKNGSGRVCYLNKLAVAAIKSILDSEPPKPTDLLFPFKGPAVSMAFTRVCRELGIENFSFHDLRHTCASWLRMKGADIHTVASLLGHKDLRQTVRYAHLSPEFLGKAVGTLDDAFGDLPTSPQRPRTRLLEAEVAATA